MSGRGLLVVLLGAITATVSSALGAHLYLWEYLLMVWTVVMLAVWLDQR